jgi:hypothetical protein
MQLSLLASLVVSHDKPKSSQKRARSTLCAEDPDVSARRMNIGRLG